jgi:hypothetical protein
MSYDGIENKESVGEEQRLHKEASICQEVNNVLESNGWKNTIGPLIDRMIMDIVGGKIGDTWVSGKLDKAKKDERREFYVGYKQSLIDLHSRIMFHKQQLFTITDRLSQIEKDKQVRYRVPMVDDTRYRTEEKI